MKIYTYRTFLEKRTRRHDPYRHESSPRFLKRASGNEDMLDISQQALSSYRQNHIIELNKARNKKIAESYLKEILSLFADSSNKSRQVDRIRLEMNSDNYTIDDEKLAKTADSILGLFA